MNQERVRLRPEIASMVPYAQGRPASADAFKLSSNENPFPPLPSVVEAIAGSLFNRYPDASAAELTGLLAARHGVDPRQIQVAAGSVSVLAQLITAAASVGDEVLYSWRSFEAYPGLVATAGATSVRVPNTPDHRHDLPLMLAAVTDRTRVAIVCTPNNPTSTIVTTDEFVEFMAGVPPTVLVVLDEAYGDFVTDPSAVRGQELLSEYPNLVLLRTFSKAYGLAGLRIGYGVGPAYVMDAARAVAIPLSVTELAQRAATASLEHEAELLDRVAAVIEARELLMEGLRSIDLPVPTPHGNFVWLPTGELTGAAASLFERHGVVARALGDGLRVSVGEREAVENTRVASVELVDLLRTAGADRTLD